LVTVLVVTSICKFRIWAVLDNITIRDELGLKTFGAASEQFEGVARKPEAATAVKVFELVSEGSEGEQCRVCQGLASRQGQPLNLTFWTDEADELIHKVIRDKETAG